MVVARGGQFYGVPAVLVHMCALLGRNGRMTTSPLIRVVWNEKNLRPVSGPELELQLRHNEVREDSESIEYVQLNTAALSRFVTTSVAFCPAFVRLIVSLSRSKACR